MGSYAEAGISDEAAALANVIAAATAGGSAKLIRQFQYDAKGRIIAAPTSVDLGALATGILKNTTTTGALSIAAAGTDYLAPDWDLISRQVLGADAQDITIACAGDTDGRIVIDGFGPTNAGGADFTARFNGGGTAAIYAYAYKLAGSAVSGADTGAGFSYDSATGFTMVLDVKTIGTGVHRGGVCWGWTKHSTTTRGVWLASIVWPVDTGEVTSIVLRGTDADSWKTNFRCTARRRPY